MRPFWKDWKIYSRSFLINDLWYLWQAWKDIYKYYSYSTWRYVDLGDSWRPHHHSKKANSCSLRVAQIQQVGIILASYVVAAMGPGFGLHVHPIFGSWWFQCLTNKNSELDELLEGRQFWEPIRGSQIPQWQPDLTPWVTVPATWPVPGLRPHKTCALPWWNKKGFLKNWLFVVCVSFFLGLAFADAFAWHISWDVVDNLLPNLFSRINAVLS